MEFHASLNHIIVVRKAGLSATIHSPYLVASESMMSKTKLRCDEGRVCSDSSQS